VIRLRKVSKVDLPIIFQLPKTSVKTLGRQGYGAFPLELGPG
jgi:hypothetical protein